MISAVCVDEFRFHYHHLHLLHLVQSEFALAALLSLPHPHIEAFAGSNGRPLAGGEEETSLLLDMLTNWNVWVLRKTMPEHIVILRR